MVAETAGGVLPFYDNIPVCRSARAKSAERLAPLAFWVTSSSVCYYRTVVAANPRWRRNVSVGQRQLLL